MSDCVACGHGVVAWDPEESATSDDLICYGCGLHAKSEAADHIAALQARVEKLEAVRRAACDAVAYLQFGSREPALDVLRKAIDAAMRGE